MPDPTPPPAVDFGDLVRRDDTLDRFVRPSVDLDKLMAIEAVTTPGPWTTGKHPGAMEKELVRQESWVHCGTIGHDDCIVAQGVHHAGGPKPGDEVMLVGLPHTGTIAAANAEFVAASRAAVPALIAWVRLLEAFIDEQLMPRYVELFDVRGLGDPACDSVMVEAARAMIGKPAPGQPPAQPGRQSDRTWHEIGRQVLREENEKMRGHLSRLVAEKEVLQHELTAALADRELARQSREHTYQWYGTRLDRLRQLAKENGFEHEFCSIVANGVVGVHEPPTGAQQVNMADYRAEQAEKALADQTVFNGHARDAICDLLKAIPASKFGVRNPAESPWYERAATAIRRLADKAP